MKKCSANPSFSNPESISLDKNVSKSELYLTKQAVSIMNFFMAYAELKKIGMHRNDNNRIHGIFYGFSFQKIKSIEMCLNLMQFSRYLKFSACNLPVH